jgi:hypothetical protein
MLILLLWALSILPPGCGFFAVGRTIVIDEPFTDKNVQKVRPGATTRAEILDRFGPPLAVVRPGEAIKVPHWNRRGVFLEDVPADGYFSRFDASTPQARKPVVYYYEAAKLDWTEVYGYVYDAGGPLYVPSIDKRTLIVQKFWILLDEESGRVIDLWTEKTEDGKTAREAPKKSTTNFLGVETP